MLAFRSQRRGLYLFGSAIIPLRKSAPEFIIGRMVNNWFATRAGKVLGALCGSLALVAGCRSSPSVPPGYQGVVEFESRRLGFEFAGRLESLSVHEGEWVSVGAPLARLDNSLLKAEKPVRESEAAAADQAVLVVKTRTRPEAVRAADARLRAARVAEDELRRDLQRERELLLGGATPEAQVDSLESQLSRAEAERQALAHQLKLLRQGATTAEIAQGEARAAAVHAALDALETRLHHHQLSAPIAGQVLDVYAEPGEVVAAGAPVLTLADIAHPYADVFVPAQQITAVVVGAEVRVRVDGLPAPLSGTVENISQTTEFTPRYLFSEDERPNLVVRTRIRIDDPEHKLRAGLPAFVELALAPSGAVKP